MKKVRKIITCCAIGTLAFTLKAAVTEAAEMPIAGIDLVLEEFYQSNENADNDITKYLSSMYKGISFANVKSYVNIRSKANEESEILGKLYQNSAATIQEKEGDWYQVKSGSVTGYIKSDYLFTGEKAEELSGSLGVRIATVTTTTLKVREKATTDSKIVTLVPIEEELKVLKEQSGWVKVSIDSNTSGYVSADYVKLRTEYEEAVSIEEERERLEEEEAAREVSNSSSSSKSSNKSSSISSFSTSNKTSSSSNSSLRSKIVDYALRFEGNPYVWGGTSLTNGADCSGFTQSVFGDYGISIPRTSRTQASSGRRVSMDNIKPGDLVFYTKNGRINHVAIYIGNGKVISASSPKTGIRITSLYYRQPYKAVNYID